MPSSLNADNGVVSGTAGLKSSADSSGVLDLQTNGTTAISISASQVVSFANQPTYTGGTANGVMFLNGSKAVTTGTALTFDGAILSVNGISVGRGAGAVATNTAVGASALAATASGGSNTGIGYLALTALTSGSDNTSVGRSSLASNTTGSTNVAVGVQALTSNTTASNNTAVGYQAGYLATGGGITALGHQAYYGSVSAGYPNGVAVGFQALYAGGGGQQVAVGYQALTAATSASGNDTAVGYQALSSMTSGANNSAFGRYALLALTTGSSNVAVGAQALASNTTASNNTAVGYQALYSQTSPTQPNVGVGRAAGYGITTGGYNVCVGELTGNSLGTGISNTFIGVVAGYNSTGSNNTFIGSGSNGYGAGWLMTTGSKNTILGAYSGNQNGLDIRTTSNVVVLSDGDGVPVLNAQVGASIALQGAITKAGTGITFPATQAASADANTLDDYEEGTFTPVIQGGTTAGTYTSALAEGVYVKIGKQVTVSIRVAATNFTGTGDFIVAGLPFAAAYEAVCPVQFNVNPFSNLLTGPNQIVGIAGNTSATTIIFRACDTDTTGGNFNQLTCGSSTVEYLRVGCTYYTS